VSALLDPTTRNVRQSVVATFYVRRGRDIDTRYTVTKVTWNGLRRDEYGEEYLVNQYDHRDAQDVGRLVHTTPFDTMAEAVALCLRNAGWGEFLIEPFDNLS
jgi:hypothetical protein